MRNRHTRSRRSIQRSRWFAALSVLWLTMTAERAWAGQRAVDAVIGSSGLRELSASVESLTRQVSQSVVQVQVTGYGPVDRDGNGTANLTLGRRRSVGAGVIIDGDGYIVTNAHVVIGAEQVQVVLHGGGDRQSGDAAGNAGRIVEAKIVGVDHAIDLALLKVEVAGLRPLQLADYTQVRQGQLVFAFGSPEGFRDSVTMGVVSAVSRQPDPDDLNVYIQTDAPINPGNSGGPLVNVDGKMVGLNTFIISSSGGNEGLGFAIPSSVIASAYPELRAYGQLRRGFIGLNVQAITPAISTGLELPDAAGVLVADVTPGAPADLAGVLVQDVIVAVGQAPVPNVPAFGLALATVGPGDSVKVTVRRGAQSLTLTIAAAERPADVEQLIDLADPQNNAIAQLGIVGAEVTADAAGPLLPNLRIPSGVAIAAKLEDSKAHNASLAAGDVVHGVNGLAVRSIDGLRVLLNSFKQKTDIVLQIERNGHLMFVVCSLN